MFRRNNRSFFSSVSRHARRASKAIARANRSNAKWMKRYEERQERFARWKKAFTFIPLNFSRFAGYVSAFFSMLSAAFQAETPRVALNRDGILGSRKRRGRKAIRSRSGHKSDMSSKTYEAMEPKQMLAADLFVVDSNAEEVAASNTPNNGQFEIRLDAPSTGVTTVQFSVGGTAALGLDYAFDADQVSVVGPNVFATEIAAGQSVADIDIIVLDDTLFDPAETVRLELTGIDNGGTLGITTTNPVVIADNESQPVISVSGSSTAAAEGDPTPGSDATFTIDLTTPYDSPTLVEFDVTGTALGGIDFEFTSTEIINFAANPTGVLANPGTLSVVIPAGETLVTINVEPFDEGSLVELTETVVLTPDNAVNADGDPVTIDFTPATVFITDDDTAQVSIASTDGEEGALDASLTFNLTDPVSTNTTVAFTTSPGTATFGVDYYLDVPAVDNQSNSTLGSAQNVDGEAFNPGATGTPQLRILGTGDGTFDFYSFTVPTGSGGSSVSVSPTAGVGLTVFDFAGNVVGIANSDTVAFGGSGTFSLRVSDDSGDPLLLDPAVPTDGVALLQSNAYEVTLAIDDHATPQPTTVTIPAGVTSLEIPVFVTGVTDDAIVESDEVVDFVATSVVAIDDNVTIDMSASAPNNETQIEIVDNDIAEIFITGVQDAEEETGVLGIFTVETSNVVDVPVNVPFEIVPPLNTLEGAEFGVDYTFGPEVQGAGTAADPFFVVLPANTFSVDITIVPINEPTPGPGISPFVNVEQNEAVTLRLLDDIQGSGVNDNDSLQRDGTPDGDSDVVIEAGEGEAEIDILDIDRGVIAVNSNDDFAIEGQTIPVGNGQFTVGLFLPQSNDPDSDDFSTANDSLVNVVSSDDTTFTFTISGDGGNPLDIDFGVFTPNSTTAPGQFEATIPAGQSNITFDINALIDALNEPLETVTFTINSVGTPSGDSDIVLDTDVSNLSDNVQIIDENESLVSITAIDPIAREDGVAPEGNTITFRVQLDTPITPATPVTVNYDISGAPGAVNGEDYYETSGGPGSPLSGTVEIPAGQTFVDIEVTVFDDDIVEGSEDFTLTLTSATVGIDVNVAVDPSNNSDTATIIDDDAGEVFINVTDSDLVGQEAGNDVAVVVEVTNPSSTGVLVPYTISFPVPSSPLTPASTSDFQLPSPQTGNISGTVFINPNETQATIDIDIINDAILESGSEYFFVTVGDPADPLFDPIASPTPTEVLTATVEILRDQLVSVDAIDATAVEGTANDGTFRISITEAAEGNITVNYTVTGTASNGVDFSLPGSVILPGGASFVDVTVDAIDDLVLENDESVVITLDSLVADLAVDGDVQIDTSADTDEVTIIDNDFGYVTIVAGDKGDEDGPVNGSFVVTLFGPDGNPTTAVEDVVVDYTVTGTATASSVTGGGDFVTLPGQVIIPAGSSTVDIDVTVLQDSLLEGKENVTITLDAVDFEEVTDPEFTDLDPLGVGPFAGSDRVFLGALGGPVITFDSSFVEDTFVRQGDPLNNFSSDVVVEQDSNTDVFTLDDGSEVGLLRFNDIIGSGFGQIPLDSVIEEADLFLLASDPGTIAIHNLLVDFDFSTLTFANANFNGLAGVQADGLEAELDPSSTGALFGLSTFDLTDSISAFADGQDNFGFAIFNTATGPLFDSSSFFSSETVVGPLLSVTLDTSATIDIHDDEVATIDLSVISNAVEDITNGVLQVQVNGATIPSGETLTVDYTIGVPSNPAQTATGGGVDFVSGSGTVTVDPVTGIGTFELDVELDNLIEGTEFVVVTLDDFAYSGPGDISLGIAQQTVAILDNDAVAVTVASVVDASELPVGQNPADHQDAVFLFSLGGFTSTTDTEVEFEISGTATAGMDFVAPTSNTVTIPAGATSASLAIDILDDLYNENSESLIVTITGINNPPSNPGITFDTLPAIENIEDDDALTVTLITDDATEGGDTGSFVFELNTHSDQTTVVPFTITGNSADLPDLVGGFVDAQNVISDDYALQGDAGISFENVGPNSPLTGFVTFSPGETEHTLTVTALRDFLSEFTEEVEITLGTPVNVNGVVATAGTPGVVNINDEIFEVSVTTNDQPAEEDGPTGTDPGFNGQFTVSITNPIDGDPDGSGPLTGDVLVSFSIPNDGSFGTALFGDDYTLSGAGVTAALNLAGNLVQGTVVIPQGETSATITVEVVEDSLTEPLEDIVLTLTGVSDAFTAGPRSSGTPVGPNNLAELGSPITATESIADNDASVVSLSVVTDLPGPDPVGIGEDNNNGAFRFSLDNITPGSATTVTYEVVLAGTTAESTDFQLGGQRLGSGTTGLTGSVVIPAGASFADVLLDVDFDLIAEGSEDVQVRITGASSSLVTGPVTFDATPETATIEDNDIALVSVFAIDSVADEGPNDGTFRISLSNPSETDTEIFFTVGGDATRGTAPTTDGESDFMLVTGPFDTPIGTSIVVPAGQTDVLIDVQPFDDPVVEDNETVILTLTGTDNGPLVVVDSGTDLTGRDLDTDTVTIIPTTGDDQAVASITEVTPAGEDGTVGTITVELTQPADYEVTVPIIVTFSTGTGNASAGDVATIETSVTFAPGATEAIAEYTADDDSTSELPEDFSVALGTPSLPPGLAGGLLSNPDLTAVLITSDTTVETATIIDNDGPQFTINSPTVVEGTDLSEMTFLEFEISLDTPISFDVDVDVVFGASSGIFGGADFASATQTVTFGANDTTPQTIQVEVFRDNLVEADETFTATLVQNTDVSALGAGFGSGTGTIINDDTVTYTVENESVTEGTGGGFSTLTFTITPDNPVDINIPVDVDFTGDTATGFDFDTVLDASLPLPFGADFDTDANEGGTGPDSSLVFVAGSTSPQTVTVRVAQDNIVEGAVGPQNSFGVETFDVDLSTTNTSRSTDTTDGAVGTIVDDDSATVILNATDGLAAEPGAIGGDGEFTFSLSNPVQSNVEIEFSFTVDGETGDANNDIEAQADLDSGTITIPGSVFDGTTSGDVTTSVSIPIIASDDALLEDDEDVLLQIDALPAGVNDPDVSIDADSGIELVEIVDDDRALISIEALDSAAVEGGVTATFEVSINGVSDEDTTVDLEVISSGTTASSGDFSGVPSSVTIPAGQTSVTFEVTAVNDTETEDTETLEIGLVDGSLASNADITIDPDNQSDSIDLLDDGDGLKVVISGSTNATEDDSNGTFTFSLVDAFGNPASLEDGDTPGNAGIEILFEITGGSADIGDDFSFDGVVTFLVGQEEEVLTIDVNEDFDVEGDETISIRITGIQFVQGAAPATALLDGEEICFDDTIATTTIIDNDGSFAVTGVSVGSSEFAPAFNDLIDPTGVDGFQGVSIPTGADQDNTVPFVNIDRIFVEFNSDIDADSISADDFQVTGVGGGDYTFTVSVDEDSDTARLEFSESFAPERLTVVVSDTAENTSGVGLDGEFVNGDDLPSGNGTVGGDFSFDLNILPGNVTGDMDADSGATSTTNVDVGAITSIFSSTFFGSVGIGETGYDPFFDVNGDGFISNVDTGALSATITDLGGFFGTVTLPGTGTGSSSFVAAFGLGSEADVDDTPVVSKQSNLADVGSSSPFALSGSIASSNGEEGEQDGTPKTEDGKEGEADNVFETFDFDFDFEL